MRSPVLATLCVFLPLASCAAPPAGSRAAAGAPAEREALARVVEDWHDAAARGDGPRYFAHMTDDAVFLGTDRTERWAGPAFRSFAQPYFKGPVEYGSGAWTYRALSRHVALSDDGRTGWWDEVLWNEKYGHCRGTGVAVRGEDDRWRIAHFGLAFLVPNEAAAEITARVRAIEGGAE